MHEILDEVLNDPWSRPYEIFLMLLKNQPMPLPTDSVHSKKIVTVLFPHQPKYTDIIEQSGSEISIPAVTEDDIPSIWKQQRLMFLRKGKKTPHLYAK